MAYIVCPSDPSSTIFNESTSVSLILVLLEKVHFHSPSLNLLSPNNSIRKMTDSPYILFHAAADLKNHLRHRQRESGLFIDLLCRNVSFTNLAIPAKVLLEPSSVMGITSR